MSRKEARWSASELSYSKSLMVLNRQVTRKVARPSPALVARASRIRDANADRHGTRRPSVGGVTAPRKCRKRGSRGKNIRKSNTGSSVGSNGDSDTETSQSYPSQLVVPDEDASVSSLKVSDHPSSLDIEAEHDEQLFVGDVPTPKLSDQEKSLDLDSANASSLVGLDADYDPQLFAAKDKPLSPHTAPKLPDDKTAGASSSSSLDGDAKSDRSVYGKRDVPTSSSSSLDVDAKSDPSVYGKKDMPTSLSSSLDVDAKSDPSVYGKKDMPTSSSSSLDVDAKSDPLVYGRKDMPVNETSESAPDGQNHFLIKDEIDSVWSHGESTHRVVTQTQEAHATTQVVP
jgi:hypothetical protein